MTPTRLVVAMPFVETMAPILVPANSPVEAIDQQIHGFGHGRRRHVSPDRSTVDVEAGLDLRRAFPSPVGVEHHPHLDVVDPLPAGVGDGPDLAGRVLDIGGPDVSLVGQLGGGGIDDWHGGLSWVGGVHPLTGAPIVARPDRR